MNFKIIEKIVCGKSTDFSKCEDKIVTNNNFVCLIDGATSKSRMMFNDKTQGIIAGELIEKIVNDLSCKSSIFDFIDIVNHVFKKFYIKNNLLEHMDKNPIDRLNASVVLFSAYHRELWLIGDCQVMLDNKRVYNPKLIDKVLSELRAFIIDSSLKEGCTIDQLMQNDIGREKIMPFMEKQFLFQNDLSISDYSYSVLDGYPINQRCIKVCDVRNVNSIVLATDGYPKIFPTLEKTERYLKKILTKDPLCYWLYKSTKGLKAGNISFDDRAYIKIELN